MTPKELKALRHKRGLSQADLAHRLSVDRNTVNRWEMGKHPISPAMEKFILLVCKNA